MKKKIQLRHVALVVLLVLVALLTYFVHRRPDSYLDELRKTEAVTEGSEEAVTFANSFLELLAEDKLTEARALMTTNDGTEFQKNTSFLTDGSAVLPIRLVGFRRLVHTHNSSTRILEVESEPRHVIYAFSMCKNAAGEYRIIEISSKTNVVDANGQPLQGKESAQ